LASITSWLAIRSWLLRAIGGACLLAYVLSEPARALPIANAAERARSPSAPTTSFDSEAAGEAEALARRWAPGFLQHASAANPERDLPLRVDFDGDWSATNNWQHLTPAFRAREPSVYYSAILTRTHAYLTFTLFYPRDWLWPAARSCWSKPRRTTTTLRSAAVVSIAAPGRGSTSSRKDME
jgi:hypothetical protein